MVERAIRLGRRVGGVRPEVVQKAQERTGPLELFDGVVGYCAAALVLLKLVHHLVRLEALGEAGVGQEAHGAGD